MYVNRLRLFQMFIITTSIYQYTNYLLKNVDACKYNILIPLITRKL